MASPAQLGPATCRLQPKPAPLPALCAARDWNGMPRGGGGREGVTDPPCLVASSIPFLSRIDMLLAGQLQLLRL